MRVPDSEFGNEYRTHKSPARDLKSLLVACGSSVEQHLLGLIEVL